MYLSMVCGMFVCVSLSINVCMFTVSNALLMSNATAMVRVGGMVGCCCSSSETYGRKWGDSNFQILTELPVLPQAAGVVGTF